MAYKTQLSPQYTSPINQPQYMYFTSSSQLSPGATGCMRNRNVGHSPAGPCCEDTKTTSLDTFCVPCLSVGLAGKGQAFLHLLRSYMQKSPHSNRPNREREGFMSSSQTGDRFSMLILERGPMEATTRAKGNEMSSKHINPQTELETFETVAH
ncbi:hypothetical protein PABG_11887 [Paracoccidioides brasiliensis Pb03]|nr:hypothetical protein PABG_11887 [Paracoccidioides brasiliensis Pb03]